MSSVQPSSSPSKPPSRTPGYSRWFIPLHIWLYRRTGGLLGHRLGPQRILLLTTTGRKSGQPRTQPLAYFRNDAGHIYLVGSNWGNDAPPAWYLNAQENPHVRVQLKRDVFDAVATPATPEERARLWPGLTARQPQYARYQSAAAREIPLVFLRPIHFPR